MKKALPCKNGQGRGGDELAMVNAEHSFYTPDAYYLSKAPDPSFFSFFHCILLSLFSCPKKALLSLIFFFLLSMSVRFGQDMDVYAT